MGRGRKIRKKPIVSDPVYKSRVVTRMISRVMQDGKKDTAESIVYSALQNLHEDKKEAIRIFEQAVRNVMPPMEVRPRRVGGATYQVPVPVKHDRGEALALRWIVGAARERQGKSMDKKLAEEIKDAYEKVGIAIKKKENTYRMAEANRAFAHFRW